MRSLKPIEIHFSLVLFDRKGPSIPVNLSYIFIATYVLVSSCTVWSIAEQHNLSHPYSRDTILYDYADSEGRLTCEWRVRPAAYRIEMCCATDPLYQFVHLKALSL